MEMDLAYASRIGSSAPSSPTNLLLLSVSLRVLNNLSVHRVYITIWQSKTSSDHKSENPKLQEP